MLKKVSIYFYLNTFSLNISYLENSFRKAVLKRWSHFFNIFSNRNDLYKV